MEKKDVLTKILAILGAALVLFPILAPLLFSVVVIIKRHMFRFYYLMPVELFPITFVGGGLLIRASLRAHARLKLISWSLGIASGLLFGWRGLAVVQMLSSGETESAGAWWSLVDANISLYLVGLVVMGIGGALLVHDLFKPSRPSTEGLQSHV